jgi:hypothetical protein
VWRKGRTDKPFPRNREESPTHVNSVLPTETVATRRLSAGKTGKTGKVSCQHEDPSYTTPNLADAMDRSSSIQEKGFTLYHRLNGEAISTFTCPLAERESLMSWAFPFPEGPLGM